MTPRQLGPLKNTFKAKSYANILASSEPPASSGGAAGRGVSSRGSRGRPVVMLKSNHRLASCSHCSAHHHPCPYHSKRLTPLLTFVCAPSPASPASGLRPVPLPMGSA